MGGKNSKNKEAGDTSVDDSSSDGGLKLLTQGEVKEILSAMDTPKKMGISARFSVKEASKEEFVAAIKTLDTSNVFDLLSAATGATGVDIFADMSCDGVFWSVTTEDKPEDVIKYLEDEKYVKFSEDTVTMLTAPPGYILYCVLD